MKLLQYEVQNCDDELLSASYVDKSCYDDHEDPTLHRENCDEELLCVSYVDKGCCCDEYEDATIHGDVSCVCE